MSNRQPNKTANVDISLAAFACPNEDCSDFNRFGAGNLSVCEWIGKGKNIRRLYCRSCGHRFSERQGTLLQYAKLPEVVIVRVVKCLVAVKKLLEQRYVCLARNMHPSIACDVPRVSIRFVRSLVFWSP